jgi:glucose-1-phosphate thymidylyltransferase long form
LQALILAAGKSTRTKPLTDEKPKCLIKILNKSIIEHTLDSLIKTKKVTSVIIIVGYFKEQIMDYLGFEYDGIPITYVFQKEQKGTGHAVQLAKLFVKDEFLCINGDDIYSYSDIKNLVGCEQGCIVKEVENPQLFGIFEYDTKKSNKKLIAKSLIEKPKSSKSNLANIGIYKFKKSIFDYLNNIEFSVRGELELTSAIELLIKSDKKNGFELLKVADYWLPIAYPWDVLKATAYLVKNEKDVVFVGDGLKKDDLNCSGFVVVGDNCHIPKSTKLDNCIIFNDVTIGENCEIKNSIIGDFCYLGDNIKIESGSKSNILVKINDKFIDTGMSNFGCVIGDFSRVKSNKSIPQGLIIDADSEF